MKAFRDIVRTLPLVGAIALAIVAIFYLSDDGMSTQGAIVVDSAEASTR